MATVENRGLRKAGLETITLGRLLAHQFLAREDIIWPWLRQGESAMLWAAAGTGKTLLTLTLAIMAAGGGEVLGWRSERPRKVLLVDGEMAAEDLKERVEMLLETVEGIDRDAAAANLHILSRNWQEAGVAFPDLGEREAKVARRRAGQDVVYAEALRVGADLLLLDNFSTLVEVADENDAASMNSTLAFLLRLKQARVGCVLVHHSGKTGETYRGSSKLATTFEVILGLRPVEGALAADGAAFRIDWSKYRREPCEAVRSREVRLICGEGRHQWVAAETLDDDVRRLMGVLEQVQCTTGRELAAALGWDASKVTRVKRKAVQAGRVSDAEWNQWLTEARELREGGGVADEEF